MSSPSTARGMYGWRVKPFRRISRPLRARSRVPSTVKSIWGRCAYGDAFVAKLDPSGSHLLYSTYLGGSGADGAFGLAVDATGAVYVAGGTQSTDFPTTPGALSTTYTGYNPNQPPGLSGRRVCYETRYLGASCLLDIYRSRERHPDADCRGCLGPGICERGLRWLRPPRRSPPAQRRRIPPSSSSTPPVPRWCRRRPSQARYLALDGKGGLYSAGTAYTLVFFSTPHAFQTEYGGGDSDAFAAKVDFSQPAGPSLASVLNAASLFPGYASAFALEEARLRRGDCYSVRQRLRIIEVRSSR